MTFARGATKSLKLLPILIHEPLGHRFSFYLEGKIWEGINLNGELHGLVYECQGAGKAQARRLARYLTGRRIPITITCSDQQYALWISLRTLAHLSADQHRYIKAIERLGLLSSANQKTQGFKVLPLCG
ncbi:MAG: hypothetical protein VKJ46_06720 [Leptolyngbyaceae bacterium]|nr:hypothetical protein [Leptolyngbyaceae bacterium]